MGMVASQSKKTRLCRNVQRENKLKPTRVLRSPSPAHLGIHLARRHQKAWPYSSKKNAVGGRKSCAAMCKRAHALWCRFVPIASRNLQMRARQGIIRESAAHCESARAILAGALRAR